jgi:PPIC-type PPIASE domain
MELPRRQLVFNHILVRDEGLARRLHHALDGRGLREFEEAAREHSQDPSSRESGGLLTAAPGQLLAEYDRALHAVRPGQLSEPFESRLGWALIRRRRDRWAWRGRWLPRSPYPVVADEDEDIEVDWPYEYVSRLMIPPEGGRWVIDCVIETMSGRLQLLIHHAGEQVRPASSMVEIRDEADTIRELTAHGSLDVQDADGIARELASRGATQDTAQMVAQLWWKEARRVRRRRRWRHGGDRARRWLRLRWRR